MEIIGIAIVTFGLCYLVDKGFTRIFRGCTQHSSGLSVRLSKRYASIGLILLVVGLGALFAGMSDSWVLVAGGALLMVMGAGLVTYYMTFGIFYDGDSFILTTFGKRSTTYRFSQIQAQQLYNSYGSIVIELHMTDGRTVQLQDGMVGLYPFLDHAFDQWCVQRGKEPSECAFHDPDNSCWFPQWEV